MSGPRADSFARDRGIELDRFQLDALDALDAGRSVLVAAPTGSGKTLVAEYAIDRTLERGGKAFYTTPLKALSNQKYRDFSRSLGSSRVGLLTGDNSIRGEASVVVMTTEVLRSMIYASSPTLDGLQTVVLDEVHYLQDRFRGAVWEEVIIHLPPAVTLVCLSATISNAEELADWLRSVRGDTTAVIEERRPVELRNLYLVGERGAPELHLLPTFVPDGTAGTELRPNPEATRLDSRTRRPEHAGYRRGRLFTPRRIEVLERLHDEGMLPAIYFVFSRAGCDQAVEQCLAAGLRFTTDDERRAVRAIAERHTAGIGDHDLEVLDARVWLEGLVAGIGDHHAGMVPAMKEAVEEAFTAGLVKVVFATETLALGINMPARAVVIEKLTKFTGEHHEFLTPGEYTQLTGRAGRRGIDDLGDAVVCYSPFVPFDQVAALASRRTYELSSSFRPTFNMAVNLALWHTAAEARHLLTLSFAQFRTDREVVSLERRLEHDRELLARQRADARCERGDLEQYRALEARARDEQQRARDVTRIPSAIDRLRPGDVVLLGRHGGRVVVLGHDHGRRGHRILALGADRRLVRLGPRDFDGPPRAAGSLELPRPYAPRNPGFRRQAAAALRGVAVDPGVARAGRTRSDGGDAAAAGSVAAELAGHPVRGCPDLRRHLRAAAAADRLARDVARLERRAGGHDDTLARQLDRVVRVLEAWGYLDGWEVTDAGRLLARLYTEPDLVLAEALREGLLDGLGTGALAALVSCFTYERRGPDEGDAPPPVRWPDRVLAGRWRRIARIATELRAMEEDAGLPETRPVDPGFAAAVHAWAGGAELVEVLDEDLTGGDFVRNVKQCVDLLRQVADVAPDPATREVARAAADACLRGVVASSGAVPA